MRKILAFAICCMGWACGGWTTPVWAGEPAAEPLSVAVLHTVLGDFAREIGGDRVEVVVLMDPDVDPHRFEPTPGDIRRVASTALVIANGLGFEPYLDRFRRSLGNGPMFLVVGDAIPNPLHGGVCEHGHDHGDVDPHWWHSVENAKIAVRQIRDTFAALAPNDAREFQLRAEQFLKRLAGLDQWVVRMLETVPEERRVLVTSHDALGYFARDHGFEVISLAGISSADQPSSRQVRDVIETIRAKQIPAVFPEYLESPGLLQEVARESGARVGGVLHVDGLGEGADTYEAMIRQNVSTIVSGLR